MDPEGHKKPGLVPFPRFFAVFGYAVFSFFALLVLAEAASQIALPIYHRIHYRRFLFRLRGGGLDSEALLSQRRGIGRISALFQDNIWLDMCSASPAYTGYSWAEDFWRDQRARTKFENSGPAPYEPFRVWGSAVSHSQYVNVDEAETGAQRRTLNSFQSGCDSQRAKKVWLFGASNMWGLGTPDLATIPSYLSKVLNETDHDCVEVTNMGVDGFDSNQELVYLIQLLKAGRRPDVVAFFDGYAEAYVGTIDPGNATTHWGYTQIKTKYESGLLNWPDLVKRSSFLAIVNKLKWRSRERPNVQSELDGGVRVKATMDNYEMNLYLIRLLAKEYQFKPFFFWQPYVMYGNKPLVPFEQSLTDFRLIHEVYEEADRRATATKGFVFLGRIFDQVKEPIYIDPVHLGPLGNEIVARAMASEIQPALSHQ